MLEKAGEVAFAEFGDEVGVVFGGVDIVEVKDVRFSCEYFENGDFELEQHLVDGILEFSHFDDFDADVLAVAIIDAFVDGAAVALADVLSYFVGISLDGLHRIISLNL